MSSLKQIKTRIKSVKNTKKVTKTMELISAIKLQKAVDYALSIKRYSDELDSVVNKVNIHEAQKKIFSSESKNNLFIIISADRGLAGSYIGNLRRFLAQDFLNEKPSEVILIGKKLFGFLNKVGVKVDSVYKYSENPELEQLADRIFKVIKQKIETGNIGQVNIIFTNFYTISKQVIEKVSLFNNDDPANSEDEISNPIDFESSKQEVEEYLASEIVRVKIHSAIASGIASEHLSRMIAMKNATESSQDIIDALQLIYNKTRQANITREIIEIISGMQNEESSVVDIPRLNRLVLNF